VFFDMNVKQPSHEKILLSRIEARVLSSGHVALDHHVPGPEDESLVLSENDAIRLAAFLARWYRERNRAEVAAEAERIAASRAAKKARYAERQNRNRTQS
jgi:hypothetical protein